MLIEYATITAITEDKITCTGGTTGRVYTDVEFIEDSTTDSPPSVADVGIIMEIANAEVVWIGRLKQFKSSLLPKELRLRPGETTGIVFTGIEPTTQAVSLYRATVEALSGKIPEYEYTITEEVSINNTGDIIIRRIDANTENTTSEITLANDDSISISNTNCTVGINASGALTITATGNVNITAPVINLN